MYVCMQACKYVCMYVCRHACMYVCLYVCMCVCKQVCMYACVYICMYVCMYVCKYGCMYASVYAVCMLACMRACVCVHVCTCACLHACEHGATVNFGKRVQTSKIVVPESGTKQAAYIGDVSLYPNGRGTRKRHLYKRPVSFHFLDRSSNYCIAFLGRVNGTEMPRINPHVHASDDDWNAHTHTARSVGMVGAIFHSVRRIVNLS